MDFDLEIISEEGERPDPLFDSIMNAMNSMKEATADKIYRKIQKEGTTNYSKPQVDKALENALKYGIFEVRNNRYRVRDDVLDDEDTVYWKFQKKRDQTPFRIEENVDERQNIQKLDPEKDNKRFRKPSDNECFHCGRTKRSESVESKTNNSKRSKDRKKKRCRTVYRKTQQKKGKTKQQNNLRKGKNLKRKATQKSKAQNCDDEEKGRKRRKLNCVKENKDFSDKMEKVQLKNDYFTDENLLNTIGKGGMDSQDEESDTSEMELLNAELACSSYASNKKEDDNHPRSAFSSECITADLSVLKESRSSVSIKSLTKSQKSLVSSTSSNDQSQTRVDEYYNESINTSGNVSDKLENQYLSSSDTYRNKYKRDQTENKDSSDWLGCSEEQQGAIIQTNNVLTIEPMDSLAFTEHASYIS